jgi:FKBP-type peptidyl-prolyl cis-trans isomerase 2
MLKADTTLAPGEWVRLAAAPEWGVGQVQSVAGNRVTVNFEHAGKRLVMTDTAVLESVPVAERNRS